MATFTNLDQEKLAEAEKHEQRKANTLGSDKPVVEEPFANAEIILLENIFSETPTASTAFAAPYYGDWPYGSVASCRTKARLHPLITSGMTGTDTIQTFVAVSSTPASDNPVDIEAVRIKHLVPPDLSPGRTHAADLDPNFRGFELALFPAFSGADMGEGAYLDGYDGYGAIPITADPSAVNGMGADARWTVDYANGIVRFTDAPLNGQTGVMNPFNVYGDINGQETTVAGGGRVTMFATFYQYTGPSGGSGGGGGGGGVTVGDGTNSFGTYYGPTSTIMQFAVDSLATYGGTVYLKEGDYTYTNSVNIPENVEVVGVSKRAQISRPAEMPAFIIQGSNTAVTGLTVKTTHLTTVCADIEIITTGASQTIENVNIKDNILWATHDAYGVGFAPRHMNATYRNINIEANSFDAPSSNYPVFIGESHNDASVTLENINIHKNDFTVSVDSIDGYAVYLPGKNIEDIRELHITDNHIRGQADIGIDVGQIIENVYLANNSEFRNLHLNGLSGSIIKNNVGNDIYLDGYITDSQVNENIIHNFNLTESASDFMFSNNTCFGKVSFKGDNIDLGNDGRTISNVSISNNKLHGDLAIAEGIDAPGSHVIENLTIENNKIDLSISFVHEAKITVTNVTFNNLQVRGNTIGGDEDTVAISCGEISEEPNEDTKVYLSGANISGNTIYGDAVFSQRVELPPTGDGMKITGNAFDMFNRGIRMDSHELNHLLIENNKITYLDLFVNTENGDYNSVEDIVIRGNVVADGGYIIIRPPYMEGSALFELNNVSIDNNIFEGIGHISVLETLDTTSKHSIFGLSVCYNKLFSGSLHIGRESLSNGITTDIRIKGNNIDGALLVGGGFITNFQLSDNNIEASVEVRQDIINLVCSDNTLGNAVFVETIDDGTITGNRLNGAGLGFLDTLTNVTLGDNSIDGYLAFSDITRTTVNGNTAGGDVSVGASIGSTIDGNSFGTETGDSLSCGAMSTSKFSNNKVVGDITLTTYTNSLFTDNIVGTDTVTSSVTSSGAIADSVFTGSVISGALDLDASALTDSKVDNNVVGGALSVDSLADSSMSYNSVGSSASVDSTCTESIIDGNNCGSMSFGGNLSKCSLCNNVASETGIALGSYTLTDCTVNSNTAISTGPGAFVVGDITDSALIGNDFRSTVTGSPITFGDLLDSTFANNTIDQADGGATVIGSLDNSKVLGCVFNGPLALDEMVNSSFADAYVAGTFTMSDPTIMLGHSHITGCDFGGDVSITSTLSGVPLFNESSFTNNIIGLDLTFTADVGPCLRNSIMSENRISGHAQLLSDSLATTAMYILEDSTFSNNVVSEKLTIDFDAVAASSGQVFDGSVVSGNHVGTLVVGINGADGTVSIIAQNTTITSNVVLGDATFGDNGRFYPDSSYVNCTIGDNSFFGDLTLYGRFDGSSLGNNTFGGDLQIGQLNYSEFVGNIVGSDGTGVLGLPGGMIAQSNFVGNTVNSTFSINSYISNSNLNSNAFTSTFIIYAPVLNSLINDNNITGTTSFSSTFTESSFSDNHSAEDITFADTVANSVITGNVLDSAKTLEISGSVYTSVIATNKSILIFSGDCADNNISSNNGNISITNATLKENLEIIGNKCSLSISSGNIQNSTIVGNNFASFTIGSWASDCTISDNYIENASSFSTFSNITFGSNHFDSSLTFTGSVYDSQIVGNHIDTTMTFDTTFNVIVATGNNIGTGIVFTGAITDSIVSSNLCGTITLPNVSSNDMIFNNNIVDSFNNGAADGSITYTRFIFDGNISTTTSLTTLNAFFDQCTFDGNSFEGDLELQVNSTNVYVLRNTSIINNIFFGPIVSLLIDQNVSNSTGIYKSTISGNRCYGHLQIYSTGHAVHRSNVNDNTIEGYLHIYTAGSSTGYYALYESTVNGNRIDDTSSINNTSGYEVINNSVVSNNIIDANFSIGSSTASTTVATIVYNSVISNNSVSGVFAFGGSTRDGDVLTYDGMTFSNNTSSSYMELNGKLLSCNIEGNVTSTTDDYLRMGSVEASTIANNTIESYMRVGYNSNVDPIATRSTFSGNLVVGDFTATTGSVTYCNFTGNNFEDWFNLSTEIMTHSSVSGNLFEQVTIGKLDNVVWNGNRHSGIFYLYKINTTVAEELTFTGNLCESTVFVQSGDYSVITIKNSTYTGNVFAGIVTFGNSGGPNEFLNLVFSNNSGFGGLTFNTDDRAHYRNVQIVGNTMSEVIRFDGVSIAIPNAANAEDVMLALNSFGSYNGIAFDDSKSIGWGDNKDAVNGDNFGSNVAGSP